MEQSSRKLQKVGCKLEHSWSRSAASTGGKLAEYFLVNLINLSLEGLRAEHWVRICGMSSSCPEQFSDRRQCPLLLVQWLQRASVLYRPETMIAWIVAIATFDGEDPADVKSGWQEVMDIKQGLKKESDVSGSTSVLRTVSQWSTTLFFTRFLKESLLGGFSKRSRGCGSV